MYCPLKDKYRINTLLICVHTEPQSRSVYSLEYPTKVFYSQWYSPFCAFYKIFKKADPTCRRVSRYKCCTTCCLVFNVLKLNRPFLKLPCFHTPPHHSKMAWDVPPVSFFPLIDQLLPVYLTLCTRMYLHCTQQHIEHPPLQWIFCKMLNTLHVYSDIMGAAWGFWKLLPHEIPVLL